MRKASCKKSQASFILQNRYLCAYLSITKSDSCCDSQPGERYVYKFMCEPDVLFSMAAHQPPDMLSPDYVHKLRDDSWTEYSPSYTSDVMTLYNGVHFSRYFGYKEEHQSQDTKMAASQFLSYPPRSGSSFDLVSSSCSCADCTVEKANVESAGVGYECYDRRNYYNKFLGKEKYIIRSN